MPGYVIHIAVAQEYLRKHLEKNENYQEFVLGTITPDEVKDKSLTHYGPSSSDTNLRAYLKANEPDNSFKRGFFLHLVVDYLFYNHYLSVHNEDVPDFKGTLHSDYNFINKDLIDKYNVQIPEKVKNKVSFAEGEPQIVKLEIAERVIDEISDFDLDMMVQKLKAPKKGEQDENEKSDTALIIDDR